MIDRYENLERLKTEAIGQLSTDSPWLVLSTSPIRPASAEFTGTSANKVQEWVRRHVTDWPAPIPIGSAPPDMRPDKLTFTQPQPSGKAASKYYYAFHSDGSAVGGLQIGVLRNNTADGKPVWALGEGALAWIIIAMLRLNAAFACRVSAPGKAEITVTVVCPVTPGQTAPIQLWSHANATYAPADILRSGNVSSDPCTVDLTACLSPSLPATARPVLVDILQQLGGSESRHIAPDGVIRRRHFTGHEALVEAWTKAIGVPSEP